MRETADETRNVEAEITDRAVCEAYAEAKWRDRCPDAILAFHFPHVAETVIHRAMERVVRRGLIECGSDIRFGWLTGKGAALLEGAGDR